jgi:hypothetical protein
VRPNAGAPARGEPAPVDGLLDAHLAEARHGAQCNLAPSDTANAIREQNAQFAAGRFGDEPMPGPEPSPIPGTTTPGRLVDPRELENIILRSEPNGGALHPKDVARVELGSLNYAFSATFNGSPPVPSASICSRAPTRFRSGPT